MDVVTSDEKDPCEDCGETGAVMCEDDVLRCYGCRDRWRERVLRELPQPQLQIIPQERVR